MNFIVMQSVDEQSVFGRVSSMVTGVDNEDFDELPIGRNDSTSTVVQTKSLKDGRFSIRHFNIHLITSLPREGGGGSQRMT